MDKTCRLLYLPMFYQDLNDTVTYIAEVLENKEAANKLIDEVETAITKRLSDADGFPEYKTARKRSNPYYWIPVKNYIVFYTVIETDTEKIMEVRRFLYNRRDIKKLL